MPSFQRTPKPYLFDASVYEIPLHRVLVTCFPFYSRKWSTLFLRDFLELWASEGKGAPRRIAFYSKSDLNGCVFPAISGVLSCCKAETRRGWKKVRMRTPKGVLVVAHPTFISALRTYEVRGVQSLLKLEFPRVFKFYCFVFCWCYLRLKRQCAWSVFER